MSGVIIILLVLVIAVAVITPLVFVAENHLRKKTKQPE